MVALLLTGGDDDGGAFWYAAGAIILAAIFVAWIAFRLDAMVRAIKDRWGR